MVNNVGKERIPTPRTLAVSFVDAKLCRNRMMVPLLRARAITSNAQNHGILRVCVFHLRSLLRYFQDEDYSLSSVFLHSI